MAEKNNAYCTICGKPYYVCMSCLDSMRLSPWKIHTDTAEHFKVSQIVHGVSTNVYTKDEAKIKLKKVNLDDMDTFRPHIKKIVEDILKENETVEKTVDAEIAKVIEDNAVIEDVEEVDKTENIAKPMVSRKKNYKAEVE